MDPESRARRFVDYYYWMFDNSRMSLMNLYRDASTLTFEGEKNHGARNIVSNLMTIPFVQCKHTIFSLDVQPSGVHNSSLVFVTGMLKVTAVTGEGGALKFSELFNIVPVANNNIYVLNDFFRFHYGLLPIPQRLASVSLGLPPGFVHVHEHVLSSEH